MPISFAEAQRFLMESCQKEFEALTTLIDSRIKSSCAFPVLDGRSKIYIAISYQNYHSTNLIRYLENVYEGWCISTKEEERADGKGMHYTLVFAAPGVS